MLNTLHDGPFSQMKEQGDIHVHHYQKGENPDDKKKKEKEAKANGNGNGASANGNGNGAPANGNGNGAPAGAEAAPPPPEDPGNTMPKFSKDEVKRIKDILKKDKADKKDEVKLDKKKEKVDTKPKMKDTEVKEMSSDLAYRAASKAEREGRGGAAITGKQAGKRKRQSQRFIDYSIKKTLRGEEFEHAHNQALRENAKRDIMAFGARLKGYSDRSGGIDKDYFNKIANTALSGRMPDKRDIDGDTDPRDFVLDMMNRTFPKATMQNYAGISPSFDQYLKSKDDIHDGYDVKTAKTKFGKITVKSFDSHDDAKAHLASMNKKGHKGIISQGGKPVNEISDIKILDTIHKAHKIDKQANTKGIGMGPKDRTYGLKKSRQAKRMHDKLMKRRDHRELERHGRFLDKDEPGYRKAGIDKGHKDRAMHMKNMKKYNEEVELDEVESAYAKQIADYKARGGTIKKHKMDKGNVKRAVAGFRKKFAKTQKIHSDQDERDRADRERNRENNESRVISSIERRDTQDHKERMAKIKAGKKVTTKGRAPFKYDSDNKVDEAGDMKIPPYANRKTAQAEKKARELAQRKRAGLDEARKSDYQLYHKDFSSAMQHAYEVAKKRGYTVNPQEIDNKVATGPRKPSSGKTNRYILGTDKKQNLHVQVANLDNKRYELNMYIEEVVPEENIKMDTNEKQLDEGMNTLHDGAFTNEDPIRDAYNKMVAKYNEVDPHTGKELNTEEQLNEKEDELEEHCGECGASDHVDEASPEVKKRVGMFNRIRAMRSKSDGKRWVKTDLANEAKKLDPVGDEDGDVDNDGDRDSSDKYLMKKRKAIGKAMKKEDKNPCWDGYKMVGMKKKGGKEVPNCVPEETQHEDINEVVRRGWKKGTYHVKDADGKIHGTYKSGSHASKAMHKLMDKGVHKELEVSRANEEVSKNVSKLNKILENRKSVIADGQGGAGDTGTPKVTNKYKQETPGQIAEGNVTIDSADDFRKFEHMVEYLMGVSVKYPENFQMFEIEDTGKYRIEHEHGPIATICETDVRNFFGPNVDMEMFIDMARGWGLNITTPEQSHVVGDETEQSVVKQQAPGNYAEEFSDRYGLNDTMNLMRQNIEALAKRI